ALFGSAHPNAYAILASLATHIESGKAAYDPFFQRGDKPADVQTTVLEIKHHISDPLAGSVVSHLSAATALVHGETGLDHVCRGWAGAGCVERRVLQQPDELTGLTCGDFGRPALHGGDGLFIGDRSTADAPFSGRRSGRGCVADYQRASRINHSSTIPWQTSSHVVIGKYRGHSRRGRRQHHRGAGHRILTHTTNAAAWPQRDH